MSIEIKPIETVYGNYLLRSRLEAKWAFFFDLERQPWQYELEGFVFDGGTRYLPDFYLPKLDLWLEVKPLNAPRVRAMRHMGRPPFLPADSACPACDGERSVLVGKDGDHLTQDLHLFRGEVVVGATCEHLAEIHDAFCDEERVESKEQLAYERMAAAGKAYMIVYGDPVDAGQDANRVCTRAALMARHAKIEWAVSLYETWRHQGTHQPDNAVRARQARFKYGAHP